MANKRGTEDGKRQSRTSRLELRLSPEERSEFEEKANQAGSASLAAYLRECVVRSRVIAKPKPSVARGRMVFLMNKSSNNLNQLAHRVNSENLSGHLNEATFKQILIALQSIEFYMRLAVDHVD